MELYTYIKNCTEYIINSRSNAETKLSESEEKYHYPDGIHLFECIRKLLEELIRRSKKVTAVDYNKLNIIKPNFLIYMRMKVKCHALNQINVYKKLFYFL